MFVNLDPALHTPQANEDPHITLEHLITHYIAGTVLSSQLISSFHLQDNAGDRFSDFSSTKKQRLTEGQDLPNTGQLLTGEANFRMRWCSLYTEVLCDMVKRICNKRSEERHPSAN